MITATKINFGYRRSQPIVQAWSGSVAAGEVVSIVGPSGCGKSTLLFLLGTLVRPWSGSLVIGGVEATGMSDRARSDIRAGVIGFVFQDALLDTRRTVLDNIIEGAVYRGDDRNRALRRAAALLEELEVGVEGKRRASDLSGGQAQRVALCRAVLNRPPVILADEPTGNLDTENARAVETVLFDQATAGSAVLIVTHNERLAGKCDRTLRL